MNLFTVFISTFLLVFIGELGDKTQIAAGTGTLANRKKTGTIFLSSVCALTAVSGITVFGAGLIPAGLIPKLTTVGGTLLILYGLYLLTKKDAGDEETGSSEEMGTWMLFFTQFLVVFTAELGDKTQIATLAAAIENRAELWTVFIASASALFAVTSLTVWGVTKIPKHWVKNLQRIGASLMILYGIYMLIF